jgi:hypothetical protein
MLQRKTRMRAKEKFQLIETVGRERAVAVFSIFVDCSSWQSHPIFLP